ncbi:MAG: hypothetical protein HYS21_09070 [Deltaproteobacteria bacterium]|nr:hypothetical protein [Deltaproteobacteria bacterium]
MKKLVNARKLVNFIKSIPELDWATKIHLEPYGHIGATLTDAGLQSSLNYNSVVLPRVRKMICCWPSANTTSGFLSNIKKFGLEKILNWSHQEKLNRIQELALFLFSQDLETEQDLAEWLRVHQNKNLVLQIKGVGPKTVNYLQKLVGLQTITIDRHLINFANMAGISHCKYAELETIYEYSADLIGSDYLSIDKMIWNYMSNR